MIPNWVSHLKDPDEKKRFTNHIFSSRSVLDRQKEILDQYEAELDTQEADPNQYSSPSWAALQADRNGYRRALRKIKKLINLDHKE